MLVIGDGIGYWLHRAFHRDAFMWRIHAVHHSSTELDFGTAHFPREPAPAYGLRDERLPEGFLAQLAYPLRRRPPTNA